MRRLVMVLLVSAGCLACAEPPQKEFHQAQGAIEAARAAGAEQFAAEELAQAEQALQRYDQAVAERDFRQALNHALSSRERAAAAAKKAAAEKSAIRGEVERAIANIAAEAQRARATTGVRRTEAAARTLKQVLTDTDRALQEARAALEKDDVRRAREVLNGVQDRLTQALTPPAPQPPAPPQRRR